MTSTTGDDLVDVLTRLGVDITNVTDTEIGGRCPVHALVTGKEDRTPSWSMNSSNGLWICYACGARGNLTHLVGELSGDTEDRMLINKIIIESGLHRLSGVEEEKRVIPTADVDAFRKFKEVPEQLLKYRGIDETTAYRFGLRWDPTPRHWIIPIISPLGELWGWQAKGKGYFRNVPVGVTKSHTLFGLDHFRARTAVLMESPLDVARMASLRLGYGVGGLASFGAHVSAEQLKIVVANADKLVIALDNDEAGICAAERVARDCPRPRGGITFLRYEHTNAKDIGDMTNDEIAEAVSGASAIPWWL
jgi:hypothetical protein